MREAMADSVFEVRVNALLGKSLLLTRDWTIEELETLLELAGCFERMDRHGRNTALLKSRLACALFFDQSTRTKSAWAGAAARLGMQPVIFDGTTTQVAHGETAAETGAMLGMNAHALGIRHDKILDEGQHFMREMRRGLDEYLEATGDSRPIPIVNLQCDVDHPTQTLADFMWLRERFPDGLAGRKIAVTWAYSPSYAKPLSVPQGLIELLPRFGARVVLAHPPGYDLSAPSLKHAHANCASGGSLTTTSSMDDAFDDADVVYPKSWGRLDLMRERIEAHRDHDDERMLDIEGRALDGNAAHRDWICDERRMRLTKRGKALYMHCLPADIGAEVSTGVMKNSRIDVARQANKKLYVIMAAIAAAKIPDLAQRLDDPTV